MSSWRCIKSEAGAIGVCCCSFDLKGENQKWRGKKKRYHLTTKPSNTFRPLVLKFLQLKCFVSFIHSHLDILTQCSSLFTVVPEPGGLSLTSSSLSWAEPACKAEPCPVVLYWIPWALRGHHLLVSFTFRHHFPWIGSKGGFGSFRQGCQTWNTLSNKLPRTLNRENFTSTTFVVLDWEEELFLDCN